MNETPFHLQLIRETLSLKQRANESYSLRAFSRDIGMDSSTLSQVLNGKRPFPFKNCDGVARALRLTPLQKMKFLDSVMRKRVLIDSIALSKNEERYLLDESHYRIISEWEHYAALTLLDLDGFIFNLDSVSERLGITALRVQAVIQNLINSKLINSLSDGSFSKSHESVRTTEDISSVALMESHLETLELGKTKLESTVVDERDYSSINFAFDPSQMTELKVIIREFRKKVAALAKSGEKKSEVYQLAIQTYPLTKRQKRKNYEKK
jgi:uncharacterized protein (TIGR02147 family)